jgi:hypothetical protein
MRAQVRVWIERDQADIPDLRDLQIPEDLPGQFFIGKPAVLETDHPALDFSATIAVKIELDGTEAGKLDLADDAALRAIVQKTGSDPPTIPKFLRHDASPSI